MSFLSQNDQQDVQKEDMIQGTDLLDKIHQRLIALLDQKNLDGFAVHEAMRTLCEGLNTLRISMSSDQYRSFIERARQHPLRDLLFQDPFTRRVFEKPRGLAGDAVMLDYLYYGITSEEKVTPLGREILQFLRSSPAGISVCNRAKYMGNLFDDICSKKSQNDLPIRVLSIASGHAREIQLSRSFSEKKVSFVALDMDKLSLDQLLQDSSQFDIEVRHSSVSKLLKKEFRDSLGQFDLVYSCGLFDYLSEEFAKRLTEIMTCDLVKPGGKVVIANFMDHFIRGYMEVFMDWNLIYRDIISFDRLTSSLAVDLVQRKRIFKDDSGTILFIEIDTPIWS